jgi:hypothetical protein
LNSSYYCFQIPRPVPGTGKKNRNWAKSPSIFEEHHLISMNNNILGREEKRRGLTLNPKPYSFKSRKDLTPNSRHKVPWSLEE